MCLGCGLDSDKEVEAEGGGVEHTLILYTLSCPGTH